MHVVVASVQSWLLIYVTEFIVKSGGDWFCMTGSGSERFCMTESGNGWFCMTRCCVPFKVGCTIMK